jgi:predicted TIM-barrel fold metal-dependent hydrolase
VPYADALRQTIQTFSAIDHHAHLLAGPDTTIGLPDLLTESREPAQIAAVREHPAFHRALGELAAVLDVEPTEDALLTARNADFVSYARRLLDACRLSAVFVDDGYTFPGALSLAEHTDLIGHPVRRIVRIEAEVEAASQGGPSFTRTRERFRDAIASAMLDGAVALKTIAAYRCGLNLPEPDVAAASAAYDSWRRSGGTRLTDGAIVSYFIAEALDMVRERPVPLQIHTGLGDADLQLAQTDPVLLQPHLDHGFLAGVPIVLLHTYPFIRQASYLASLYPSVHLDLSLAVTLVPHRAPDLLLEALELAPATKVLFGTDASRRPELFLLATRWWRESLAQALARLVDGGFADELQAVRWAKLILAGNADRLYLSDESGPSLPCR